MTLINDILFVKRCGGYGTFKSNNSRTRTLDDLYGIVMVVDKEKKYDEVLDFIKKYTL